jgi:hypothetical protein
MTDLREEIKARRQEPLTQRIWEAIRPNDKSQATSGSVIVVSLLGLIGLSCYQAVHDAGGVAELENVYTAHVAMYSCENLIKKRESSIGINNKENISYGTYNGDNINPIIRGCTLRKYNDQKITIEMISLNGNLDRSKRAVITPTIHPKMHTNLYERAEKLFRK